MDRRNMQILPTREPRDDLKHFLHRVDKLHFPPIHNDLLFFLLCRFLISQHLSKNLTDR
jgi:hypothetical protein